MNKICKIILLFLFASIGACSAVAQTTTDKPLVFDGPSNLAFKHTDMFVVVGDVSVELFLVNPLSSMEDKASHISRYNFSNPSIKETEAWVAQFGKEKLNPKTTRLFSSTASQEQKEFVRRRRAKPSGS